MDLRGIYQTLVEPAGDFLAGFRDPVTGLPDMCWDLWEERRGVHTFTVASVWAGLTAAAKFAYIFGDAERANLWTEIAQEIRKAADEHLFDTELDRYLRGVRIEHGKIEPDKTVDASVAGLFMFKFLSPDDPRLIATMEKLESRLWVKTWVGGMARYEHDTYYQTSEDLENVPGNPWFICTMWLAQWQILKAKSESELERPTELLRWCMHHALESGVMAEQINPFSGVPISVSPLTWSHATFVATVCQLRDKHRELKSKEALSVQSVWAPLKNGKRESRV